LNLIQTQLLCLLVTGGGTGGGGATCGSGAPVAAPSGTCGLYYDNDSGSPTAGGLWFWDNGGSAWVKML
jgi:hypothetical protein